MIKEHLEKLVGKMVEIEYCKEEERELIQFGLESAVELSVAVLTTVIIGTFLDLLLECILFLATFGAIRSYTGGFHCKSAVTCYLASCSIITLTLLVIKYLTEYLVVKTCIALLVVAFPIIWKLAPLETPTKPLDDEENKYFRKKAMLHLGVACVLLMVSFILKQKSFCLTMCLAIFWSALVLVAEWVRIMFTKG